MRLNTVWAVFTRYGDNETYSCDELEGLFFKEDSAQECIIQLIDAYNDPSLHIYMEKRDIL